MKRCFKCKDVKPADEFYRHPQTSDGYLGKCKECTKTDVRTHRQENRAIVNAYDRAREELPHRIAAMRERERSYRAKNPERSRVNQATRRAIKDGMLVRLPCEACGCEKVVAHHDDYSKPLDVRWLCQSCHVRLHRGTLRPF